MSKGMSQEQNTQLFKSEVRTRILVTINVSEDVKIRVLENDFITAMDISGETYLAGKVTRGDIESSDDGAISSVNIVLSNITRDISSIIANQGDILTNKEAKLEEIIFNGDSHDWSASTYYQDGEVVSPLVWNGFYYEVTTGGTSGETEPDWIPILGAEVISGDCVLTAISPIIGEPVSLFSGLINNVKLNYGEFQFDIERNLGGYSTVSPNATYDVNCQVKKFKDERCLYTGAETWCDKTFARCKVLNNTLNFYGFPTIVQQQIIKS